MDDPEIQEDHINRWRLNLHLQQSLKDSKMIVDIKELKKEAEGSGGTDSTEIIWLTRSYFSANKAAKTDLTKDEDVSAVPALDFKFDEIRLYAIEVFEPNHQRSCR